ncbi:hypothetical protein [Niastella sp. OAS944]|uniref:hypothetical protein n=1 Tax=Niastella sp. OAS944 TaxID=2664089 RepID=UPI0035C7AE02|nr:hypothetical protein [Chitinophagaceae bacterium OAS944]
MKLKTFIILFLLPLLFSCNNHTHPKSGASYKDSVLAKYLRFAESSSTIDTTDTNYKTLKGYIKNDTSFFTNLDSELESYIKIDEMSKVRDSCIRQPTLPSLGVDEAYRFNYHKSFCPYTTDVTISIKGDSINFHFILYQQDWATTCKIINEYDKKLTIQNWNEIQNALTRADFWGLKKYNGYSGLDGDGLTVTGYRKGMYNNRDEYHLVYRWSVNRTALIDPFIVALKFSGDKQGCMTSR